MAKIILAGGSGFIGQILTKHFLEKGDEVVVLTRKPKPAGNARQVYWDAKTPGDWIKELESSNVLINLTGKSVNCRYTESNKREILESRVNATKALGQALELVVSPPKIWFNAASATIYRHAEDQPQDEFTGELGSGFSVDVCRKWEQCFYEQEIPGVRKIGLRIAIVLGKEGGVIPYFKNLARFGLGGKQGNGKQYFSWVHEKDVSGIIDFLISRPDLEGNFNVAAPNPVQNKEFMAVVRKATKTRFGLPSPEWLLKIGAVFIGTETELILKSRWVLPKRLEMENYRFQVDTIEKAIRQCI